MSQNIVKANQPEVLDLSQEDWDKTLGVASECSLSAATTLRDLHIYRPWQIARNTAIVSLLLPGKMLQSMNLIANKDTADVVFTVVFAAMYVPMILHYIHREDRKFSDKRRLFFRDTHGAQSLKHRLPSSLKDKKYYWILPELTKINHELTAMNALVAHAQAKQESVESPNDSKRIDEIITPSAQMTRAVIDAFDTYDVTFHANAMTYQNYLKMAKRRLVIPKIVDYAQRKISKIFKRAAYNTTLPNQEFNQAYLVNRLHSIRLNNLDTVSTALGQTLKNAQEKIAQAIVWAEQNDTLETREREIAQLALSEMKQKLDHTHLKLTPNHQLIKQFIEWTQSAGVDLSLRRSSLLIEGTGALTALKQQLVMEVATTQADQAANRPLRLK